MSKFYDATHPEFGKMDDVIFEVGEVTNNYYCAVDVQSMQDIYFNGHFVKYFRLNKDGSYASASSLPSDDEMLKLEGRFIAISAADAVYHHDTQTLEVDEFQFVDEGDDDDLEDD